MEAFETLVKKSYNFNQIIYDSDWRWQLLQKLYNKNFVNVNGRDYNNLPKKIHQIWLGSSIPRKYKKWGETWKRFNPDWEYKLWTDKDVGDVKMPDRKLFDSIKNQGQKSDFLRFLILNQFGGIYADTDYECLKSFNSLSYVDFLIGVGYPSDVELYTCLIGSIPDHPILLYVTNVININKINNKGWRDIFNTTGGYFFTRCFFKVVDEYMKGIVVLPPDYFCPFPNEKGFESRNGRDYIKDCSYALHYWTLSWHPLVGYKK